MSKLSHYLRSSKYKLEFKLYNNDDIVKVLRGSPNSNFLYIHVHVRYTPSFFSNFKSNVEQETINMYTPHDISYINFHHFIT